MNPNKIGGRKIVVWILTLLCYIGLFIVMYLCGWLTSDKCMTFGNWVFGTTLVFMGANTLEHFSKKKDGGKKQ